MLSVAFDSDLAPRSLVLKSSPLCDSNHRHAAFHTPTYPKGEQRRESCESY